MITSSVCIRGRGLLLHGMGVGSSNVLVMFHFLMWMMCT